MKKLNLALILFSAVIVMAACKKSSNSPTTPSGPASSTQWTFNKTSYTGTPGTWFYDTTGQALYFSTSDTSKANVLVLAFPSPNAQYRPTPGTYYFVDMNADNIPAGVPITNICIMEVGPSSGTSISLGGSKLDSAVVSTNTSGKIVVYFTNIALTGGGEASGTLVE